MLSSLLSSLGGFVPAILQDEGSGGSKGVGVSWTSAWGCASLALVGNTQRLVIYDLLKDLISPSLHFEVVSIFFAVCT